MLSPSYVNAVGGVVDVGNVVVVGYVVGSEGDVVVKNVTDSSGVVVAYNDVAVHEQSDAGASRKRGGHAGVSTLVAVGRGRHVGVGRVLNSASDVVAAVGLVSSGWEVAGPG